MNFKLPCMKLGNCYFGVTLDLFYLPTVSIFMKYSLEYLLAH